MKIILIYASLILSCSSLIASEMIVDMEFIGEVVREVTGGKRGVCYQRAKIQETLTIRTQYKARSSVIVARPCSLNEIPEGIVKIFIGHSDGSIQKDAWHLIKYEIIE